MSNKEQSGEVKLPTQEEVAKLPRWAQVWNWLRDEHNRAIVVIIGGAAALVAGALWTVFVFMESDPTSSPANVSADRGSVAIGELQGDNISINAGLTEDKFHQIKEEFLAEVRAAQRVDSPVDPSLERDLVAAVDRLAHAAQNGDVTAMHILETNDASELADYLAARRVQLAIAQASLNKSIDADLLNLDRELLAVASTTGRIDEAEEAAKRILEKLPDDLDTINRLGHVYSARGQLELAEASYHRVLDLASDDESWHVVANGNIGLLLKERGDFAGAERYFRDAIALATKLDCQNCVAANHGNLAIVLAAQGKSDEAEDHLLIAINMNRDLGLQEYLVSNYASLAGVKATRGDFAGAEKSCAIALKLADQLSNLQYKSEILGQIGMLMQNRGDLFDAERVLRSALEICKGHDWPAHIASLKGNLGIVLYNQGNLDEAEDSQRAALEINKQLGRRHGEANCYGNLGIILMSRGNLDEAEAMHRKAIDIDEQIGRPEGLANDYGNLGSVYGMRGDYATARSMWEKSRDYYLQVGAEHHAAKLQSWIDDLP